MERRNRSIEALAELRYIDSLNDDRRASQLLKWVQKYISEKDISKCIDLELKGLEQLSELFYKNINFLKSYREQLKKDISQTKKIKAFLA